MKKVMKSGFLLILLSIACTQLQAKGMNLLTNPGAEKGFEGWIKTDAGNGWTMFDSIASHSGDSCWVGSYGKCVMSQNVSLTTLGYSDAMLDSVKPISFGAYVCADYFGYGKVNLYLELLDASGKVLSTNYLCNDEQITSDAPWTLKDGVLQNYGKGVRGINFYMSSVGDLNWAGHYAPMFDDAFIYLANDYVKLSSNALSVDADGLRDTLTFTGSDSVSVSADVKWVSVSTSNDSIFVNVHKNTEALVRTAYITVTTASASKTISVAQTASATNLLSNAGAEDSYANWAVTNNGNGWAVDSTTNAHSGNKYWLSSYGQCTLKQTVSLLDKGYTSVQLDQVPAISMGAFVFSDYFWGGTISIYAELLNGTGEVLSTQYVSNNESIPGSTPWTLKNSVIENYGTGVRSINFYLVSKGNLGWAGHYAPAFDDAYIHVTADIVTDLKAAKASSVVIKMNSQKQLTVDLGDLSEQKGEISVYNLQGKQVLTTKTSDKITVLDLSLGKGLYLVKVQAENEVASGKILIN